MGGNADFPGYSLENMLNVDSDNTSYEFQGNLGKGSGIDCQNDKKVNGHLHGYPRQLKHGLEEMSKKLIDNLGTVADTTMAVGFGGYTLYNLAAAITPGQLDASLPYIVHAFYGLFILAAYTIVRNAVEEIKERSFLRSL